MAFIILIAFTRLLIICHPFILKNLYFNLFSFRLFVSRLLTMVQNEHSELKNLVNQNFSAQKPNQIWLSDITYIHTIKHGWTYLASVLDVCTRKIVGYSYGRKMDRSLVISALTNSWQNQNYPNNVILHSDRGSQYTSSEYIAAAERMGFRLSYSKKGCPFDNAPMESFHSVLKKEEVYLKHYSSFH